MAVGLVRPADTTESVNPDGTAAPLATCVEVTNSSETKIYKADFIRRLLLRLELTELPAAARFLSLAGLLGGSDCYHIVFPKVSHE